MFFLCPSQNERNERPMMRHAVRPRTIRRGAGPGAECDTAMRPGPARTHRRRSPHPRVNAPYDARDGPGGGISAGTGQT